MALLDEPQFGTPPPGAERPGRKQKFKPLLQKLRANEGQWAVIAHSDTRNKLDTHRSAINQMGGYEAISRQNPEGGFDLWARYVAPDEDA
jgi:hypothetical protein